MFPTQSPIDAQTVNLIINAGAVGVLFMVSLAVVLFIWTRRNIKPVDATTGTNMAINAFAEMFKNQNEQIEEDRALRKEEQEARRKQIAELNDRYIESISANADATNRIADNQKLLTDLLRENHLKQEARQEALDSKQVNDIATITAMKADIGQMVNVGSVPLRGLIETVARIETNLNEIKSTLLPCADIMGILDEKEKLYQTNLDAVRADIEILKTSMQVRIEEKRKSDTGELKPIRATQDMTTIVVPEQTLNVTVDTPPAEPQEPAA